MGFLKQHKWALAFVALLGVIVYLANTKSLPTRWLQVIPYGDKLMHFLLMGSFAFVANLGCRNRRWRFLNLSWLRGSVCVAVVVTLEEFSQQFANARSFDLVDLLADYLGILLLGRLALLVSQERVEEVELQDSAEESQLQSTR